MRFCILIIYKNIEVDFYIPDERYAVQACVSLRDEYTKNSEINALAKLDQMVQLARMTIVTLDEEDTVYLPNGKTINVLPIRKWILAR